MRLIHRSDGSVLLRLVVTRDEHECDVCMQPIPAGREAHVYDIRAYVQSRRWVHPACALIHQPIRLPREVAA